MKSVVTLLSALIFWSAAFLFSAAHAVEPDEILEDPELEARARVISQDLRCVVCQNETIDESNATLAQDMRRLVRQRVLAGDSNDEVLDYMVERYGNFVLLSPRMMPQTWLLWFGPGLLLIAGVFIVRRAMRQQAAMDAVPLSDEEANRLSRLINKDGDTS